MGIPRDRWWLCDYIGLPDSVTATLTWFKDGMDDLGSTTRVTIVPQTQDAPTEHVFAIQPTSLPSEPGLYAWKLKLQLMVDSTPVELNTFGEMPILAGSAIEYRNPFCNGWALGGIPQFFLDSRQSLDAQDDRVMIYFPGGKLVMFDATDLTLTPSYTGVLPNIRAGASTFSVDPTDFWGDELEFGNLTVTDGNQFVYTTGEGIESLGHAGSNDTLPKTLGGSATKLAGEGRSARVR